MTKKNLKPQQAAPVQREINTTSSVVWYRAGTPTLKSSFCGRRRRVIPLILTLTSKNVKSLFLLAKAHG
jgi:prenylated cyclic peptide (anacyclamide/piricyclamide family)